MTLTLVNAALAVLAVACAARALRTARRMRRARTPELGDTPARLMAAQLSIARAALRANQPGTAYVALDVLASLLVSVNPVVVAMLEHVDDAELVTGTDGELRLALPPRAIPPTE